MTYDNRNTGTREDLIRARSEGRSLMARRRVTILYRFSPREDLYARTQRYVWCVLRYEIKLQHQISSLYPVARYNRSRYVRFLLYFNYATKSYTACKQSGDVGTYFGSNGFTAAVRGNGLLS